MINTTIYDETGKRVPYQYSGSNAFLSGRWRRRDGDIYGNIPPQPSTELAEPVSADNPPGNLRPSSER